MIFITTYRRPKKLMRLLKELEGEDITVIDDGSEYDATPFYEYCDYIRIAHQGKQGFWRIWQIMLDAARLSKDNEFIFLQDDLYNVDLKGLRKVETPDKYALNLMDVGPDRGWAPTGYVDCIFKTNRKTLEAIDWHIEPVYQFRWNSNPNLSSGVGHRLSQALYKKQIPMILPKRNYASHGNHQSLMNPSERKKNPLVCQAGS